MSDPTRLIHAQAGSLQAALLRSARREMPPTQARKRMLVALGVSSATIAAATKTGVAIAATNAKSASGLTAAYVAKWALIGSAGALATVGLARQLPMFADHPVTALTSAVPNSETRSSRKSSPPAPNAVAEAKAVAASPAPTAPDVDSESTPQASRPRTASRVPVTSDLAAEVNAIDQARQAAVAHDPTLTLTLVDAYQRQFPKGLLFPEAQWLRIEALVQSGRRAQAVPIAQRLLKAAPAGPLSERIRASFPEVEDE